MHTDYFRRLVVDLLEQGFCVADDVLDLDLLEHLRVRLLSLQEDENLRPAAVVATGNPRRVQSIRGDFIKWWPDHKGLGEHEQLYSSFLNEMSKILNREFFLGINHKNLHYAWYPEQSFYKRHLDQPKGKSDRKLTVNLYLNKNWDESQGGCLRLFTENGPEEFIDVSPEFGRLVVFRSDEFEHEVLPTTVPRLSVTGWLRARPLDLL